MTTRHTALRLVDEFENGEWIAHTSQWKEEAAAELRRLSQSEREGWRYADELEQERKRLHDLNQGLTWERLHDLWLEAINDRTRLPSFIVFARAIERSHGIYIDK